jgi:hypothetical protein
VQPEQITETGRRPTWNGLRGDEHGEPGDDDEQSGRDVGLEEVVLDLALQEDPQNHAGVLDVVVVGRVSERVVLPENQSAEIYLI